MFEQAFRKYAFILDAQYRWETWAAPRGQDGKLDHHTALTGDDLRDFVSGKLFPWSVDAATLDRKTWDLSVKNPNGGEAIAQFQREAGF